MIQLRRSTHTDNAQLARLRRRFFEENHMFTEEEQRLFEEQTRAFLAEHLDDTLISWHAEKDNQLVAVAFLEIAERLPHPERKHGRTGTILNVYTEQEYRNQGIAGKLVQQLLDEAVKLQLDKVELLATALGYPVYKKLGFSEFSLSDKSMVKKLG
ncbi:GNAT family N-acetyltransferase [Enterococcus sp. BWR-S5]|uniref:GNAT family N-acetyltransferase n=1 Tax=Enterococcus sp. BWR-S5 TaxID=2787714 RepID=UPI001922B5E4|nr:GNAT family N-acetyltransferase [Enterococcus sp. BWR-S5]MBL1224467.1 GNAT family N-acetyltransferase [Enterococcus sp. BWR-S5]